MSPSSRRPATAVVCAALALLAAACTGGGAGLEKPQPDDSPSQSESSLYDQPSVSVAVKKGQPGFNTRSGEEYEYEGFETDLIGELVGSSKKYLHDIPSSERENVLVDKHHDLVVATYSIEDGRDEKIDFTAPYLKTYQGVLVQQDNDDIKRLKDLKGKGLCSVTGSTADTQGAEAGEPWKEMSEALGLEVSRSSAFRKDYKTCVNELRRGNFDAVWTDKIILEGFEHEKAYADDVKVVENIEINTRQYYGIGIREGREADCERLNKELKTFLDEKWRTVFGEHFPELAEGSFVSRYRPTDEEFERYREFSCGRGEEKRGAGDE
jgi:glutamate transport system substrate-binding protein